MCTPDAHLPARTRLNQSAGSVAYGPSDAHLIIESFREEERCAAAPADWMCNMGGCLQTPDEWRSAEQHARAVDAAPAVGSATPYKGGGARHAACAGQADDAALPVLAGVGGKLRVWAIDLSGHFAAAVSGRVLRTKPGANQGKVENVLMIFNCTRGSYLDWQVPHYLFDEIFTTVEQGVG